MQSKATVNWESFLGDVKDYFKNASPNNWRKIFIPLIRGVVTDQVNRWSNTLGIKWNVQNLFARSWYREYIKNMPIPIIDTTVNEIAKLVDGAIKEGWSIPKMQNEITDAFRIFEPYRTERIARTETIRASNAGTTEQNKIWGVKQHEWLSTKDDRTRPDHAEADGQVVDVGEPFSVGGEALEYPGDPAGSPENTINCRCTTIPVVEGME